MPTVLRVNGYRFFFFSLEGREPPHIHVEKGEGYAKFWLEPVSLARSRGFRGQQLREIRDIIELHLVAIQERWHEYFSQ